MFVPKHSSRTRAFVIFLYEAERVGRFHSQGKPTNQTLKTTTKINDLDDDEEANIGGSCQSQHLALSVNSIVELVSINDTTAGQNPTVQDRTTEMETGNTD